MPRARKSRGGPRAGTPGVAYSNRTDLPGKTLPIQTGPSQAYGQRTALEQAQRAVPLQRPGAPAVPPAQAAAEAFNPPNLGAFDRPTERPDEPLTAGLPIGAGPGPEALGLPGQDPDIELRAIYMRFPNEDLRELLESRG